ncbi:hypothetical protein ACFSQP_10260 [Bizionia sediminis]|uniref:Uncharacterized protein n=1 Tax=Bizionia sediminis TaxID=1737064 RepID=A0ABW5KV59_9FLAO
MKAVSVTTIKKELQDKTDSELIALVLRLSKFKKENKELLTYLLFESHDEDAYIQLVKAHISQAFSEINTTSYFYIKKSVRKILRLIKKYARYSLKKETEIELLLHFCSCLMKLKPSIKNNTTLTNIYNSQITRIKKIAGNLHADLQHDYNLALNELIG